MDEEKVEKKCDLVWEEICEKYDNDDVVTSDELKLEIVKIVTELSNLDENVLKRLFNFVSGIWDVAKEEEKNETGMMFK